MGDDDGRSVANELFQHLVDQLLALQVDLARGLVEDQQGRIAQDRPGQGNSLPLPTGKEAAAWADDGLVAPLELGLDELMGVGLVGGLDHFVAGRMRRAVADVVQDRVVEEQRFLRHQADLRTNVRQPHVAQVDAVDPHAP